MDMFGRSEPVDKQTGVRKPRAIIIDDEPFIRNMLRDFFLLRGYEVLSYGDAATVCPLRGREDEACPNERPCSDVLLTDFNMPRLSGVELLRRQEAMSCKLDKRNKAIISAYIDDANMQAIEAMGCMFFRKPFTISELTEWLAACEQRIDLTRPLATRRREERYESCRELSVRIVHTDKVLSGIAVNISRSGLCLKVPGRIKHSDIIHLQECTFSACSEASVKWVRPLGGENYLAGVQYLSTDHAPVGRQPSTADNAGH